MHFVLIGEGAPLTLIARQLTKAEGAEITQIVSDTLQKQDLTEVAFRRFRVVADFVTAPTVDADWLISVNSAKLLPASVLNAFDGRALNLHNGPLPAYAGRHVTQWGIRNGETEFASTIHFMVPGVDAGDIVAERRFPIRTVDTGLSLFMTSFREGRKLMSEVLERILRGETLPRRLQDLRKRRNYRHDEALDTRVPWTGSSRQVVDFIRAGDYRPVTSPTYTATIELPGRKQLLVYRAQERLEVQGLAGVVLNVTEVGPIIACDQGGVLLTEASLEGRKMDPAAWREFMRRGDRLPGR